MGLYLTLVLSALLGASDLERVAPEGCIVDSEAGVVCVGDEEREDEPADIDLAPLAHNPFVRGVALGRVTVRGIEALATLPGLTSLDLFALDRLRVDLAPIARAAPLTSVYLEGTVVKDLSVLAQARHLTRLHLDDVRGVDLGFIADLPRLERLIVESFRSVRWGERPWPATLVELVLRNGVRASQVGPAEPVSLARLPSPCRLRRLDVYAVALADTDAIARCAELEQLAAVMTDLDTLAPLAGMVHLKQLDVAHSGVRSLDGVGTLTALESLRVDALPIDDLSPVASLTALVSLDASNTKVVDLSPLAGLAALENLRLDQTPVSDLSPLAGLRSLGTLVVNDTRVKNLQPLMSMTGLRFVDLSFTPVVQSDDLSDFKRARPKVEVIVSAEDEIDP
ncbi:MAG: hypothetical protein IT385_00950 [Deltaproteobacteria bacterium]|nr:hypothetical protein [Deltaproteobacteria bacterium]